MARGRSRPMQPQCPVYLRALASRSDAIDAIIVVRISLRDLNLEIQWPASAVVHAGDSLQGLLR